MICLVLKLKATYGDFLLNGIGGHENLPEGSRLLEESNNTEQKPI